MRSRTGAGVSNLNEVVQNWPTPSANQFESENFEERRTTLKAKGYNGNGFGLTTAMAAQNWQAKTWSTPAWHDGRRPGADVHSTQGRNLSREAVTLSPPDLVTETAGSDGLRSTRVLNPRFVEALMGWPGGLTDYESSETAWCQWQQQMRSVLSLLGWE